MTPLVIFHQSDMLSHVERQVIFDRRLSAGVAAYPPELGDWLPFRKRPALGAMLHPGRIIAADPKAAVQVAAIVV